MGFVKVGCVQGYVGEDVFWARQKLNISLFLFSEMQR